MPNDTPVAQPHVPPVIAVDAMGGDIGPSVVVPGALDAARGTGCALIFVGDEAAINAELATANSEGIDVAVRHCTQVAEMREKPSDILRRKKDSSIQVACRLVKDGEADGVVSAGNSGATVACGMFIMGRIKGVERPALASIMPTVKQPMVLIDVGANVDCKPHHLFQFGVMAEVLASDILGRVRPKVGLLSIGEEEGKGNSLVKEAFELFKMASLNFVGNVEGRDVFTGDVDVVVCDGFVGNVALKLSEGLGASLGRLLRNELTRGIRARLGTMLAMSALKRFARLVDYAEYGGAPLLGLRGIAIVCHGASNAKAITSAVHMAATFVEKRTNEHLIEKLSANEELTRYASAAADR
ncbi:MAG: phosphate acyltransferase PlsX [Desulfovibrionaceae bacterium]|jgi:glycerol-3-phosphate acyltransferase PlsX|nr:phosphate acyltransferase PlsX [Desulfovibrionaceae bacterium]